MKPPHALSVVSPYSFAIRFGGFDDVLFGGREKTTDRRRAVGKIFYLVVNPGGSFIINAEWNAKPVIL